MPKKKNARPEMSWIESRGLWRKRITIDGRSRDIYGKTQDEVRGKVRIMEGKVSSGMVLNDNTRIDCDKGKPDTTFIPLVS